MGKNKKEKKEQEVTEKPKKGRKKWKIILISVILAILVIGGVLIGFLIQPKEVDLSDCIEVSYSGYDGSATATVNINESKLKKQVKSSKVANDFSNKIEFEIKNNENLSNGDEIKVKAKISESFLKKKRINLKSETIKVKVKGLDDQPKLDLSKYLDLQVEGYNKNGSATVTVNESLKDEIGKRNYEDFIEDVSFEVLNNEKLENDSDAEIKINISQSWLERHKIELKSDVVKVKVSGLKQGVEKDAFESMRVNLTGMSPNISVSITNESTDEFIKTVQYTASKTSGIANGETIKISASSWDEEMAKKEGYVLKETTIDYKVDNQAAYVSSLSEINDSVKSKIKELWIEKAKSVAAEDYYGVEKAKDLVRSNTDYKYVTIEKNEINKDLTLDSAEVSALYLLTKKNEASDGAINKIRGIVKLTYVSAKSGAKYEWYVGITADNFSLTKDGAISDNAVYYRSLDGGANFEQSYQTHINGEKAKYNVESIPLN